MSKLLAYLQEASVVPSKSDSLFEKALELSRDDFDSLFDARVRTHQGFSVSPPVPETAQALKK
jgi:hypothetical protein